MTARGVQQAERAIEEFIRFWPLADPQQPLGAPLNALNNAVHALGDPIHSNPAFSEAARPALVAALPALVRALPKTIALLSTVCSAAREPAWAAAVRKPLYVVACLAQLVSFAATSCAACLPSDDSPHNAPAGSAAHAQLRQLLIDGPSVGAMAGAARLALDVSAPARPRGGGLPAQLPSAIWVSSSSRQRGVAAEACAAAAWKVLSAAAVFAWEVVQAACSLPPHMCSLRDAIGTIDVTDETDETAETDDTELSVTPEQRALAVRLVRSLQSSQLLPALCDAVLWAPRPAYAEGRSIAGGAVARGPEDFMQRLGLLYATTEYTLRCVYGVCQLAQDAGEAAAPGPSLLAAPELRRMLLSLLEILVEHGEGGTQGGWAANGGGGLNRGAPIATAAAGECAGLRYVLQPLNPGDSYVLHNELLRASSAAWRRRPDLRPATVRCHARLAARLLRAACRLHRGQGWGGVVLAECLGIDFDSSSDVDMLPVFGMIPLLTHAELVVVAAAEAPAAERLAALPDALEAAAWCLAAVAQQGSYLGTGDVELESFEYCQEAIASLLQRTAALLMDDFVTGWAGLTPELQAQVIQRLSAAGLLRSLDALLRLLVTHAPPPEGDELPCYARAAVSQACLLRPLLLPLLCTALAPPPAGGGGGSGGPVWEAPRELGVLVTAAKLVTRELWRFELEGSRGDSSRGGRGSGGGPAGGDRGGGGRVDDADRLILAVCYDQLLSAGLLPNTGLPALLHGRHALPQGSRAREAVVEALRLCAGVSFRLQPLYLRAAARMGRYPSRARGRASDTAAATARRIHISSSLQGLCTCLHALPACVVDLSPARVLVLRPGLLLTELEALLQRLAPADEPDPRTQGALRSMVPSGVRLALACMAAHPQLTGAARALLAPPEGEASAGGVEGGGAGGAPRLDAAVLVVRLRGWAELEAEALECLRRAALRSAECLRAAAALLPSSYNDDPDIPLVMPGHVYAMRAAVGGAGPDDGSPGGDTQHQPGGGVLAEGAGTASAAVAGGDAGADADAGVSAPGRERGRAILRLCGNPCCADYTGACEAELRLQQCSGCRAVWYCGAACQKQHWRAAHKRECGQLAGG
ncbi:hypothetical protein TSOC_007170 [Tetrabaena socialis]|uniref:MYND-type domain-containing protein n=1 Tax=Tetrabaena socialis TaxID=47790 RepID=A0A2J8A1S4_9CHLO|nr:hypothetical protein TSOC_007170 [Tetrabaena socialis]|eukprot:PNH06481.1 hypothetical protein TSOC_007170 [Tetrabaena socialis]